MSAVPIQPGIIAAILLAAGSSTRLGTPKQLLRHGGQSLIRRAAEAALASQADQTLVVLGAEYQKIVPELDTLPVRLIENSHWDEGIGSSIRAGIDALPPSAEAAVLLLCDQPYLSAAVIDQLIDAHRSSDQPLAACEYSETLGTPAIFARSLFPELLSLRGDRGAKQVIMAHLGDTARVPFPQGAADIDTLEEYQRFMW